MEKDLHNWLSQLSPKTLAIMKYWRDNPGSFEKVQNALKLQRMIEQELSAHPEIIEKYKKIEEMRRSLEKSIQDNPQLREQQQKIQELTHRIQAGLIGRPNSQINSILQQSQDIYTQAALSGNVGQFKQYNHELSELKKELTSSAIVNTEDQTLIANVNDCLSPIDKIGNEELSQHNLLDSEEVPLKYLQKALFLADSLSDFLPNIDTNLNEIKKYVKDFLDDFRIITMKSSEASQKQSDAANKISLASNKLAQLAIIISVASLLASLGIAMFFGILAHCDSNTNTKENKQIIQLLEQIKTNGGNE